DRRQTGRPGRVSQVGAGDRGSRHVARRAEHEDPRRGRRRGHPLVILLTPGQAGEVPMMLPLLAGPRVGRPLGCRRDRQGRPRPSGPALLRLTTRRLNRRVIAPPFCAVTRPFCPRWISVRRRSSSARGARPARRAGSRVWIASRTPAAWCHIGSHDGRQGTSPPPFPGAEQLSSTENYDILIIGSGEAGKSLAWTMAGERHASRAGSPTSYSPARTSTGFQDHSVRSSYGDRSWPNAAGAAGLALPFLALLLQLAGHRRGDLVP